MLSIPDRSIRKCGQSNFDRNTPNRASLDQMIFMFMFVNIMFLLRNITASFDSHCLVRNQIVLAEHLAKKNLNNKRLVFLF